MPKKKPSTKKPLKTKASKGLIKGKKYILDGEAYSVLSAHPKSKNSTVSRTLAADTSGSPNKGESLAENSTQKPSTIGGDAKKAGNMPTGEATPRVDSKSRSGSAKMVDNINAKMQIGLSSMSQLDAYPPTEFEQGWNEGVSAGKKVGYENGFTDGIVRGVLMLTFAEFVVLSILALVVK